MSLRRLLLEADPRGMSHWIAGRLLSLEHAFERSGADGRAENDTRVRIVMLTALFAVLFAILAAGAARAALFSGRADASDRSQAGVRVERADLVDRNGRLLASNLLHHDLSVDPTEVWDAEALSAGLKAALPRLSERRLAEVLASGERGFVLGGLTPEERARVQALQMGGLYFDPTDQRVYPLGRQAAHLIGYATPTGEEGLAGAERAFDAEIRSLGEQGQAFALSIDLRIQAALEAEVGQVMADQRARAAVGIVTNVRTGEVLGLVSLPDYEPGRRGEAAAEALRNRAGADVFEMGSTFKIFSVAAAMDAGRVELDTVIDADAPLRIGARTIRDYHAQNRAMTVEEVFLHSSNIGTSRLADRMGRQATVGYFEALGLLERAPIELTESAPPLLPARWDANTLASASFGHAIAVTPLQMAAAVGAIMNGGVYRPLTLRPHRGGPLAEGRRVVSEETSRRMLMLMRRNVVRGSGTRADALGYRVGGKTGTAEKYTNGRVDRTRVVSSFAAVFPTDGALTGDRYLILILLDEPQGSAESRGQRTAGWTAAPATGRLVERIAPFLGVRRSTDAYGAMAADRAPLSELEALTPAPGEAQ